MNFKINILSFSVFIAGLCSIVYELLISATATYFLGDGIKQFSVLIGVYLFSMGIGAYLSKFFKDKPIDFFIKVEFLLGLLGGISVPLLYFLFVTVSPLALQILCLVIMFSIGLLTGMEVPLLTFGNESLDYKDNLSNVLSLDYIGGLIATLLFPFILLPFIGLFYSSLLFGIINILLGLWLNYKLTKKQNFVLYFGFFALLLLSCLAFYTGNLLKIWDEKIYKSPIVENIQTPYQKIVLTQNNENDDVRLYLNRAIQFSSKDEYRYHELLVHVPLTIHKNPKTILILGGGENLASREVLKYESITMIDVVDIDSTIFHLAKTNRLLLDINQSASKNSKVNLIVDDAFTYLKENMKQYDVIISDLPDPSNDAIARLYSKQFFMLVEKNLKEDGIFVTQSGEIYFSNVAFSCIKNTISEVFNHVETYHTYIPSFGDWGYTMASNKDLDNLTHQKLPKNLKYLNEIEFKNAFIFPKDIQIVDTKINTIDNPVILNYFLEEWNKWKTDMSNSF
ncbi:polyamine aminopropyltransferase [Flavobacterium sp. HNIBRBA15423]|uniref:polyamine aminopropyltransferase n=1 Tax=Flavobacterium sp. HNIBRBA15423 TaxID=3458683 RepID=UPI004043D229